VTVVIGRPYTGVTVATARPYAGVLGHAALDGPGSDDIAGDRPVSGQENLATYGT